MKKVDRSNILTIRKKWLPVIEHKFQLKNENIIDLICLYSEWYLSDLNDNITSTNLPEKLEEIRFKIDTYSRIEITGTFFNPASGIVEYGLSNGEFIPKVGQTKWDLSDKDLINIFGIDFIRSLDTQKFRDNQLDKIL